MVCDIAGKSKKGMSAIKKVRPTDVGLTSSLLGYPDSNQEKQDQNLLCYHYTISQFSIALEATPLLLYCECKGTDFF